mgnify:CR=1 FL=1
MFLLYLSSDDENVQNETFQELERNDVGDKWVLPAGKNIFLVQIRGLITENQVQFTNFGPF